MAVMLNYCDENMNCTCSFLNNEQKCQFYTRAMVFSIAGSCIWRSFVSSCMSANAIKEVQKKRENIMVAM